MIKAVKTHPKSGVVFLSCVSVQDISYKSVKSCPMLVVVRHETWDMESPGLGCEETVKKRLAGAALCHYTRLVKCDSDATSSSPHNSSINQATGLLDCPTDILWHVIVMCYSIGNIGSKHRHWYCCKSHHQLLSSSSLMSSVYERAARCCLSGVSLWFDWINIVLIKTQSKVNNGNFMLTIRRTLHCLMVTWHLLLNKRRRNEMIRADMWTLWPVHRRAVCPLYTGKSTEEVRESGGWSPSSLSLHPLPRPCHRNIVRNFCE